MKLHNTNNRFGLIAILLHWIMATVIIGLFILGKYMIDLDYYDSYYHIAPWWHKSFGLTLLFLLIIRLLWKLYSPKVLPISNHTGLEVKLATSLQIILYIFIFICCISGYLISTAEDAGISFFDWFDIPALISLGEAQSELAGDIHEYSTTILIVLAGLHLMAALKHHFINKDQTLIRILNFK